MPLHRSLKAMLKLCLSLLVLQTLTTRIGTPTAAARHSRIPKPGCPDKFGNVSIPYPLGLKEGGCNYLNSSPNFFLNRSHNQILFFSPSSASSYDSGQFSVSQLSIDDIPYVSTLISNVCNKETMHKSVTTSPEFPFSISNKFTMEGRDASGIIVKIDHTTRSLTYSCDENNFSQVPSCLGVRRCETSYTIQPESILNSDEVGGIGKEYVAFPLSPLKIGIRNPRQIFSDWEDGNVSYSEVKLKGSYTSGPVSLKDDRQDSCSYNLPGDRLIIYTFICIALFFILLVQASYVLYRCMRQRKLNKRKEMLFKQNGGHLLQDNLFKLKGAINPIRMFTAEEMENATDSFNDRNVIGRGGFGDVYKGFVPELGTLAIKKPKTTDQTQTEQFINEVVLLSKIHHQNVVTFLGCCLEMDVPLLVYEYVANGTLHDHLHDETKQSIMPWGSRLKVAVETAGVLAYLHNNHRPPIIHRDIKPSNILLDSDYNTKVSDFGVSRFVPKDETQLYTKVQGTLGYLDPEYLHSAELTEKSDVYSFGVVLLELITREKVISFERTEKERSLVKKFETSMEDNNVGGIIDQYIVTEENFGEILEVAEIANRCLRARGDERPTMDEVAVQLKGLWMEVKHKRSAGAADNLEGDHLISWRLYNGR